MHLARRIVEMPSGSIYPGSYMLLATRKIGESAGPRTYLWVIQDRVSAPPLEPAPEEMDRDPQKYEVNSLPNFWEAVTAYLLRRSEKDLCPRLRTPRRPAVMLLVKCCS